MRGVNGHRIGGREADGRATRRQALLAGAGLLGWHGWGFAADPARRIVSVGGALTETLYALGAMADLVGVDTTSLYPEAARRLPSVGYARSLSAEGVLSLRPTLIVASEDAGPPAVLRQQVTSKGGTTEAALKVFEARGMRGIVSDAVKAAAERSAELAGQLGGK